MENGEYNPENGAGVEVVVPTNLDSSISLTLFQISWAFVWAGKHLRMRRKRHYSVNRAQADTNSRYRLVSYFLYIAQNILCIASFWSRSKLLLEIHESNSLRVVGVVLISLATVLYFLSLRQLGNKYPTGTEFDL